MKADVQIAAAWMTNGLGVAENFLVFLFLSSKANNTRANGKIQDTFDGSEAGNLLVSLIERCIALR